MLMIFNQYKYNVMGIGFFKYISSEKYKFFLGSMDVIRVECFFNR